MAKPPSTRTVVARLKKLLLQRDVDAIMQGVELAVSLDDEEVWHTLLDGVEYDPTAGLGKLVPNKVFSTTSVGQPWHDLALRLLVTNSSSSLKDQVTGLTLGGKRPKKPLTDLSVKGLNLFPNLERLQIKTVSNLKNAETIEDCKALQQLEICLLYTSPSPRDKRQSRMPSSA